MISPLRNAIAKGSAQAPKSADDGLVENAVEKLLTASGLWMGSAEADRNEAKQQMLEVIDRVIRLLTA